MNKLDELIKGYSQHPNNALLDYEKAERKGENLDGLRVVAVEDLEQLRPRDELAEWAKYYKATIIDGFVCQQEFKLNKEFKELLKQMEQSK